MTGVKKGIIPNIRIFLYGYKYPKHQICRLSLRHKAFIFICLCNCANIVAVTYHLIFNFASVENPATMNLEFAAKVSLDVAHSLVQHMVNDPDPATE